MPEFGPRLKSAALSAAMLTAGCEPHVSRQVDVPAKISAEAFDPDSRALAKWINGDALPESAKRDVMRSDTYYLISRRQSDIFVQTSEESSKTFHNPLDVPGSPLAIEWRHLSDVKQKIEADKLNDRELKALTLELSRSFPSRPLVANAAIDIANGNRYEKSVVRTVDPFLTEQLMSYPSFKIRPAIDYVERAKLENASFFQSFSDGIQDSQYLRERLMPTYPLKDQEAVLISVNSRQAVYMVAGYKTFYVISNLSDATPIPGGDPSQISVPL